MNIFITGATGGLGCGLVKSLQMRGHALTALTRRDTPPQQSSVHFVNGDLLNPSAYAGEMRHADAIIHLAAVTHAQDPKLYEKVNTEGTRRLIETAVGYGFAGRFLFVSTRAVGDACGAYGASKARAEEIVRKSPVAWTILRPAEIYGTRGAEAISSLIARAQSSLLIPVPGWGSDLLAPVHIDDVLTGIVQALECAQAVKNMYTLAGPEVLTYYGLVRRILRLYNRKALLLPIPYCILNAAARAYAILGRNNPPIVLDQIERLRCVKCSDITSAVQQLDYQPRSIEKWLRSLSDEHTICRHELRGEQ